MKKNVLIMFGGVSSEHEVSVISGLMIVENINRELFNPLVVYVTKNGLFSLLEDCKNRKDFNKCKRKRVVFDKQEDGTFIVTQELLKTKYKVDLAYLAFHGGLGELGPMQGLLENFGIPYTGPSYESSTLCMNKAIAKEILLYNKLPILPAYKINSMDYEINPKEIETQIKNQIKLPAVIKAVHVGSSIGVKIAKDETELRKSLLVLSKLDYELLAERMLTDMVEFNVSVRKNGEIVETSVIEKPQKQDEILSFKDKYQTGNKTKNSGMADLHKELPAKISKELETEIREIATKAYKALRCSGTVRIDFMYSENKLYVTEINTIPGLLSYYLWEAAGIPFNDQITQSLDQAIYEQEIKDCLKFNYDSDIVEKFTM